MGYSQIETLEFQVTRAIAAYNASQTIEERVRALKRLQEKTEQLVRWLEDNPSLSTASKI